MCHYYRGNVTLNQVLLSLNYSIPAEDYTAYSVLIKKIGVGRGYSAAFNLLAAEAGIKSIAVSGEVISAGASIHTWNYACLDGKYVYIDCAMDDPGFKGNDNSKDIYTSYFAVPAKALMVRHEWVADGLKDYLKY
jgi:transglutaminase/protease-like cytokinesis protein 3